MQAMLINHCKSEVYKLAIPTAIITCTKKKRREKSIKKGKSKKGFPAPCPYRKASELTSGVN